MGEENVPDLYPGAGEAAGVADFKPFLKNLAHLRAEHASAPLDRETPQGHSGPDPAAEEQERPEIGQVEINGGVGHTQPQQAQAQENQNHAAEWSFSLRSHHNAESLGAQPFFAGGAAGGAAGVLGDQVTGTEGRVQRRPSACSRACQPARRLPHGRRRIRRFASPGFCATI